MKNTTTAILFVIMIAFIGCGESKTSEKRSMETSYEDGVYTSTHFEEKWPPSESAKIKAYTLTLDLGGGVSMKLVKIPAGTFMMGSPAGEKDRFSDEGPQHKVTLTKPFYMGVYEVTQEQYEAITGKNPWKGEIYAKENPAHAASYISWDDAVAFCKALSRKTGKDVRLPTEAEWEYACRAGTATRFSHGDDGDYSQLGDYAWYNANAWDKGEQYAHAVGRKKPNAFGLYDMHGNVWEWCSDYWGEKYANADARDPQGPASGSARVLRGGSWGSAPLCCRSASRNWDNPDLRFYNVGFRVAVSSGRVHLHLTPTARGVCPECERLRMPAARQDASPGAVPGPFPCVGRPNLRCRAGWVW